MKHKPVFFGVISGVIYGLLARLLIDLNQDDFLKTMTLAYIFVTPAIIGGMTVYFGSARQKNSWPFRIMMPWVTIGTFLLTTFLLYLEAFLCVVLLLPAFMAAASIGGIVTGVVMSKFSGSTGALSLFIFLPFVLGTVEHRFDNPSQNHRVVTEMVINADKKAVWKNTLSVDTIADHELPWSYAHFIGIPKPIKSELDLEKTGGIRSIYWDKGIKFREIITDLQPYDHLSYYIEVDTIPPNAIDPHIEVGGAYFSVTSGGYQLEEIYPGKTRLTLYCHYSIASKFNFYSSFWADFLLNDFQQTILKVIKDRSEAIK